MESSSFPSLGVLPKTETGALSFISQNPSYDGRGTIVAILDTGCDPGSDGLSITSEGKPKFIDVIDSTGSGDVNTSKKVEIKSLINDKILLSPLTNNKLLLNESWIKENKNTYFNIGSIRAYDFFPKPLVKRIEKKRGEKFTNKLTKAIESLQSQVNTKTKQLESAGKDTSIDDKKALKQEIEDLQQLITDLGKETNSGSGPVFDVIVWNDGKQYNAVLNTISMDSYVNCTDLLGDDTKEETKSDEDSETVLVEKDGNGDNVMNISGLPVLTNYKIGLKYATISSETMLNYVLNIYDDGNLVSVVVPGGSHGTHVAGIVGAYYKDDPSKNGVAPGCQFISVKIGDTRLSTMETNQGLMRALYHIRENKCDLVNMSYGEPTTTVKTGCFPKGVESLVWKYGVIFISSAGNDGPCLSTAGAPQSATDAIIGIGAMFSPQMIDSEYGIVQKGDDGQNIANYYEAYSWSSRGPTMDGAIGVKIMSPGGAIAPIPEYTLSANQLMNGTSMSSPNACGNVSLLLSALKQENICYTPYGIETALINSANDNILNKIDNVARGYGLLQVNGAYQYCIKNKDVINSPVSRFEVNINGTNHSGARGIYIREPLESARSYSVTVTPKFKEDTDNNIKVSYQFKCMLKATDSWIQPAPFTLINSNGRYFEIKVDPLKAVQQLSNNSYVPVFRGYVLGINSDNIEAGPLFRIPITICNPIKYPLQRKQIRSDPYNYGFITNESKEEKETDNPFLYKRVDNLVTGKISRVFHVVPSGASAARVNIKCIKSKDDKSMRFVFATLYGKGKGEQVKYDRWARLATGDELSTSLQRVEPNTIFETTLCQYALSYGSSIVEWSVEFIGPQILCNDNALSLNTGDQYGVVTLRTGDIGCNTEENKLSPTVKFDTFVAYYSPKYATINMNTLESLGDIDITNDDKKVYNLDLEYEFDQKLSGSKNIIKFSLYDDLLYESLYEGNFYQLFDSNKQLITSGEAFEETAKIPKQKGYVLKLQLRSSSQKLLEKAKNATLRIDTVLAAKQCVSADIYSSKLGILQGNGKISGAVSMPPNSNKDLFIVTPSTKALEVDVTAGSQLLGYLKLNKDNKGDLRPKFRNNGIRGVASLCIPIALTFGNTAKAADTKAKLPEIKDDGDNKDDEKKSMEEKQRDAMIDWINKKLKNNDEKIEAFETFCKDLLDKYPDYLPLLNLKLDIYKDNENIKLVIDIADEILSKINTNELAAFFGKKVNDKNDKEYKKQLKKYKEQKSSVIDALKAKLNAIKRQLSVVKKEDDDEKGGDNKAKADPITDFVRIPKDDLKEFEDIYKQLSEWIDVEKNKKDLFDVNLFYNLQKGLVSKALAMINDKISSNNKDDKAINKDQIEMKIKLYKKYLPIKEFSFLIEQYELDLYKQFPNQYRLF